jgi:protein-L-isoaspartate O-methyltransferase
MLITPIKPNTTAKPRAANTKTEPIAKPLKRVSRNRFIPAQKTKKAFNQNHEKERGQMPPTL